YDRFAKESYAIFGRLKDEGAIPADVAFQVCFPATMSAVDEFFSDSSQWTAAHAAYRDAVAREVRSIDFCVEILDLALGDETYAAHFPQRTFAQKFDAHTQLVAELADAVPSEVRLGIHLCYGTWGGWPMVAMKDLRLCVDLANVIVAATDRHLDYVHMPVA